MNINSFLINTKIININKLPLYTIINRLTSKKYDDSVIFLKDNNHLSDKKIISISPGGFRRFYLFGVTSFIKENYDRSKGLKINLF